jgi:hypothetical protein
LVFFWKLSLIFTQGQPAWDCDPSTYSLAPAQLG